MKVSQSLSKQAEVELTLRNVTGECKDYMVKYLKCMKTSKSQSTDCRHLSKEYLNCRMEKCVQVLSFRGSSLTCSDCRGLMERANWQDLGFQEEGAEPGKKPTAKHTQGPTPGLERAQ